MTTFVCKVLDSNDRWSNPTIDAASKAEAICMLQKDGFLVAEIRQKTTWWKTRSNINNTKINRFFEMLSNQLDVGIPLLKSLHVIHENETSPHAKQTWHEIIHKVSSGQSLSVALSLYPRYFSTAEVSMIEAGQEGGFLPLALNRIVLLREWKSSISSRVRGAIAYPCILILAASIIVPAILIGIVPRFEPLYESLKQSGKMPWITQCLIQVSAAAKNYGILTLFLIACSAITWWSLTPKITRSAMLERLSRRIPFIGSVVQDWSLSQFCQTLSILLENRVGLLSALSISARASNSVFLVELIQKTKEEVIRGKSIVPPLSQAKEIDREVIAMLHVGEQSNTLPVVLNKIATQLEQRIRKNLDLSIKLIEPILMMILAALIGSIVIALILPIFEGNGLGS
jgi:general secretion pathway protein F/type IV pilus assembly protein PilC